MKSGRLNLIDSIRGFIVINMIAFHTLFDLNYMFTKGLSFFTPLVQRSYSAFIYVSFIIISGFCVNLGKQTVRRGATVFVCGAVVSLATLIVTPDYAVKFGILTFIGSAMLFVGLLKKFLEKLPSAVMLIVNILLLFVFLPVNSGYLGIGKIKLIALPQSLYANDFTAFFGFIPPTFYSSDYFSFFPWIFLFTASYYLGRLTLAKLKSASIMYKGFAPLSFIGRHSLVIYMLHQPIIYGVLYLIFNLSSKNPPSL